MLPLDTDGTDIADMDDVAVVVAGSFHVGTPVFAAVAVGSFHVGTPVFAVVVAHSFHACRTELQYQLHFQQILLFRHFFLPVHFLLSVHYLQTDFLLILPAQQLPILQ